ncbi:HAMP domain-containing protein [Desulfomarina sp.]
MFNFITSRIGLKVSLKVNCIILLVMSIGTYFLVSQQSRSLEQELLNRGKIQSIVGAKMIGQIIEEAIDNGVLTVKDAFDTNYEIIGDFDPPKYHTRYDFYLDKAILGLEDEFLLDSSIVFAVAVDRNGYLPTHNTRFQKPITGDREKDKIGNRTKRVFNDPVGLRAARNTTKGLLQIYHRDTGEVMWDVSSPIYVKGKHWGGFRIALSLEAISTAKKKLMKTMISIMGGILLLSLVLTFLSVNSSLAPLNSLTLIATDLANGENLDREIDITRNDEIGRLQEALERLRMSMMIIFKRRQ